MTETPFIDMAVRDGIREPLTKGQAVLVLPRDFSALAWANGAAARLFGHDTIPAFMEAGVSGFIPAWRQMKAAADQAQGGVAKTMVRVTSGLKSRLLPVELTPLGDGMIVATFAGDETSDEARALGLAIFGLEDDEAGAAIVDGEGTVLAAGRRFDGIAMSAQTLGELAAAVKDEDDRLVKRLVTAEPGGAVIAAGIARLCDAPLRCLVLALPTGETDNSRQSDEADEELPDMADPTPQEELANDPEPEFPNFGGPALAAANDTGATQDAFQFSPDSGPVRFVWKMDADGVFTEVSEEFARAVGPRAADITGRKFEEVGEVLNMDGAAEITASLKRRDTWSGKSVLWPVQGTDMCVPVDLAALPFYNRDRIFEGYRGFGIARPGDAIADPDAVGLTLSGGIDQAHDIQAHDIDAQDHDAETVDDSAAQDPFDGEVPALHSATITPLRRTSDSRQAENRQTADTDEETEAPDERAPDESVPGERALGEVEAAAFRQIGEALGASLDDADAEAFRDLEDAARDLEEVETPAEDDPDFGADMPELVDEPPALTDEVTADAPLPGWNLLDGEDGRPDWHNGQTDETDAAPLPGYNLGAMPGDDAMAEIVQLQHSAPEADEPDTDDRDEAPWVEEEEASGEHSDVLTDSEMASLAPDLPGDDAPDDDDDALETPQPRYGLTPETLDGLPLPLLVVRGESALFANASFQIMTGYDSIDELNARGGVDALFVGPHEETLHAGSGQTIKRAMTMVAEDGERFPASAHMQIVQWEDRSAVMLAIEPVNRAPEEDMPFVHVPDMEIAQEEPEPARAAQNAGEDDFSDRVEELVAILDIATDGVVIMSREGEIQSINGPGAALFGYRQEELKGKSFSMLFAHESQRAAMDYMHSLTSNGVASLLNEGREVLGRERNGGFLPMFMTMGRLPADGRMCAVLRDITPWKQTEQALQDAKREAESSSTSKSDFLAKISHEIRTPLNAIIGFSELMLEQRFGPMGNERYLGYLGDINKSGRHVLDLINDLLDISKIESGKQELSFEGVHLNDAVSEALAMVQPLARRERIIMRSSLDVSLPDVVADLRSVKQIVLNLLSNAVRFTPAGGIVVASTSYTGDGGVVLRIKDTGIGMTPKEVHTAMQPFSQVAEPGRDRGDGTGLGLPLTKALVEANRAEFTIHSEPGRGTIVEIHFPQARVLAS